MDVFSPLDVRLLRKDFCFTLDVNIYNLWLSLSKKRKSHEKKQLFLTKIALNFFSRGE